MANLCILLLFVVVTLPAILAHAPSVHTHNFNGEYRRQSGPRTSCSEMVNFESRDNANEANIELRSTGCRGSFSMKFERNRVVGGDNLIQYLNSIRKDLNGTWVTGVLGADLSCGSGNTTVAIKGNTRYNFFVLHKRDREIRWTNIYKGKNLDQIPLAENRDEFTLTEDATYLIQGTGTCLYRREGRANKRACFPASARVTLESGKLVRMNELKVGDRVLVTDGTYSDVFMFSHSDPLYSGASYVRLYASDKSRITLSGSHYIYASGNLVPAADVRAGDTLVKGDGSKVQVEKVRHAVFDQGMYNPHTVHGDIVVDGFVASTYTTAISPKLAHALLAPLRNIYAMISGSKSVGSNEL